MQNAKIKIDNLNLYYGKFQALRRINLEIYSNKITAIIGPSGCGKSTLLRQINRMNDYIEGVRVEGEITLDGEDILQPAYDLINLRKKVGMVFQRPNPFPLTIFNNVAYGPKVHGENDRQKLSEIVEKSLRGALLWDAVCDRLDHSALELPLGQQQQLCIARLLAVEPEVILLDEPCSALDPISTLGIEELMRKLQSQYTIIIVTHNMQQAARASDYAAFMLLGDLVEYNETNEIFTKPKDKRTEDYITGRFG